MDEVPRTPFLPEDQRPWAHLDRPLPTGYDSTNSQPSTVRAMLELLDVPPGARVLDVGCGTGWTTALLARLSGGTVVGVEIVPELVELARGHLRDLPGVQVELVPPGEQGWAQLGPYDRILVSADARSVPVGLLDQLAPGGRMVLPVRGRMMVLQRDAQGRIEEREAGGRYAFVPLR